MEHTALYFPSVSFQMNQKLIHLLTCLYMSYPSFLPAVHLKHSCLQTLCCQKGPYQLKMTLLGLNFKITNHVLIRFYVFFCQCQGAVGHHESERHQRVLKLNQLWCLHDRITTSNVRAVSYSGILLVQALSCPVKTRGFTVCTLPNPPCN